MRGIYAKALLNSGKEKIGRQMLNLRYQHQYCFETSQPHCVHPRTHQHQSSEYLPAKVPHVYKIPRSWSHRRNSTMKRMKFNVYSLYNKIKNLTFNYEINSGELRCPWRKCVFVCGMDG